MKKVGIVSCYFKDNYGSMLQAYATKRFLDNNDIENETIRVDSNKDFKKGKKKYYLLQVTNYSFIKSKLGMIKLKFDKKINKELAKNITIRASKYKEFRKEFNYSINCVDYKGLNFLANEKYSDVVVGSDQLWLPVNVVADYYTLNWVPDDVNKVSYSTSFGVSRIPEKYSELYSKFLNRIDHLSVREETGVKLVKEIINRDAALVCDPTILLSKEEWEEVAVTERKYKEKYILCYFLGNNIEHRKFAERLREKTGYKIVSLNHADEYVKYSDEFCDYAPFDIGPREWINLIKEAEYVCTDSFHGTVFSILFNKMFFDFRRHNAKNKNNTNSRIDSLLDVAGISTERILTGTENIEDVLKYTIDYNKVNENISKFRKKSQQWFINSLTYQKKEPTRYIKIEEKDTCTGCTACKSICHKDAIEMVRDNEGFLYPQVDKEKCVECGLCKKVCPVLNVKIEKKEQRGYIFQNGNKDVRNESTSGGFYTAIAENILNKDGIVYGVGFDEKFKVKHLRVTQKEELYKFRNSKYVQSDPNDTFKNVKKDLENNKLVLYSGTACQIEGLKSYLGKKYDNLITVDVICRAVPSPLLWEKYKNLKERKFKLNNVYFREKKYGYKHSNLTMYNEDEKLVYNNGIDTDPYLRAFFSNIACRLSCYSCKFKNQYHNSDFTIWDCFDVDKYDKDFDDDIGTTRVLTNSTKANKIINELTKDNKIKEIDVDKLVSNFHQMFYSINYNSKRETFFNDLYKNDTQEVLKKYFPNTLKCKIEKYSRRTLIKLGIYKPLLKIGKKIRSRD